MYYPRERILFAGYLTVLEERSTVMVAGYLMQGLEDLTMAVGEKDLLQG
jgi:hypothetical protein